MALLYVKNLIHPSRDYLSLAEPGSYGTSPEARSFPRWPGRPSRTFFADGFSDRTDLESPAIDLPESSTASRSSICEEHDEKLYTTGEGSPKPKAFDARLMSGFTIGFSDGLTVPFALTAGLSALGTSRVVIYGGLSELIAGTISMGMGGYLGAKGEA
jgi:hypothetical protein